MKPGWYAILSLPLPSLVNRVLSVHDEALDLNNTLTLKAVGAHTKTAREGTR